MRFSALLIYPLLLACLCSCKDVVPVWRNSKELKDYTLYYADYPCELSIDLSKVTQTSIEANVELVITYHKAIGRREIPLYMTVEDRENNIREFHSIVVIKEFDEWLGDPNEKEGLFTIQHTIKDIVPFKKGFYTFKIFANDQAAEKIYGVIQIELRLYQHSTEGVSAD